MGDPSLAPRIHDQQPPRLDARTSDPFATPTLYPADPLTPPEPSAQLPSKSHPDYVRASYARPAISLQGQRDPDSASPHKCESMSSTGSSMKNPFSIDLEKSSSILGQESAQKKQHRDRHTKDRHCRDRNGRDPEKSSHGPAGGSRGRRGTVDRVAYIEDDEGDEDRQLQESKAAKILFFLSGPCVVLSFLNVFWALISLVITSLAQPVRLCARRPNFGQQLGGLLGPALNLQLKSIYTPLPPHADEDTTYRPGMLLAVQFLSPFLSLGMMLAAWCAAVFWLSSAVVGDPVGTDKRDDGKETVLLLRDFWERWLMISVRDD